MPGPTSDNDVRNASLPYDPSAASGGGTAGDPRGTGERDLSGSATAGLGQGRGGLDERLADGGLDRPDAGPSPERRSFKVGEAADPAANEQQEELVNQAQAQSGEDAKPGGLDDKRRQRDLRGMNSTDGL